MELSSTQDGEIQIPSNNYVATAHGVSANGHGHHHHHHMIHHHAPPPPPPLLHHHNNIITSSSAAAVPVAAVVPQSQNPSINGTTTTTTNSTSVELDLDQSSYKKPLSQVAVKYRECLKNHAAAMGGNATDGCGEFMPSGEQGSIEALICSACHCHRNFHRKEIEGETDEENYPHHHNSPFNFNFNVNRQQQQHHSMRKFMLPLSDQPLGLGYHHHHTTPNSTSAAVTVTGNNNNNNNILPSRAVAPPPHGHIIMPFNYNIPSESDEQEEHGRTQSHHQQVVMKKRFRTKFTQEQKEKMLNFAEKVGWKFQKQEESLVQQFCAEIGVKRRVLKVWMHNNKHNLAKKQHIDISTDNLPTP